MYEEIKRMAVEAVKLQNKLNMESTLNRIAELCDAACSAESEASGDNVLKLMLWPAVHELFGQAYEAGDRPGEDPIVAGDVLVAADGQEFKVDAVVTEPKKSRAKVTK